MTNEYAYSVEVEARAARRACIDAGRGVSLIAYDPARGAYVFDVYGGTVRA